VGNLKTLTLNDGGAPLTQSFHYNKRNWLDTATLLSSAYAFNYYNDGREQGRTQTSRIREYSYYSNGWLQNITDSVSSSAELTQGFTPDAVGNIEAISRLTGVQTEANSYGYDGLNRLTSATNPAVTGLATSESYNYDATGNRDAFTYDAWNRINTALGKAYTYDADGNPDSIGGITLAHDADGRMTQYGTNNYTYDPEWRRIKKTIATGTRYYVWDGERLMAEYDATGTRMARYAYLPGDYSPSEVELNNVTYQVRTDHLGTPLELVNAANNVVWRAHYESFGNAVINDDVDGDGTHVEFNVRLPGQYFDVETGLNYNWHRYYDPTTGRYISSDPIGLMGGVNTFAYVGNNPLRYMDPYGLMETATAIDAINDLGQNSDCIQQCYNNYINDPTDANLEAWINAEAARDQIARDAVSASGNAIMNDLYGKPIKDAVKKIKPKTKNKTNKPVKPKMPKTQDEKDKEKAKKDNKKNGVCEK
jgi:RHS repeat-associated protein